MAPASDSQTTTVGAFCTECTVSDLDLHDTVVGNDSADDALAWTTQPDRIRDGLDGCQFR